MTLLKICFIESNQMLSLTLQVNMVPKLQIYGYTSAITWLKNEKAPFFSW